MDAKERQMREFLFWIVAAVVLSYTLLTPTSILLGVGAVVLLRLLLVYHKRRQSETLNEDHTRGLR